MIDPFIVSREENEMGGFLRQPGSFGLVERPALGSHQDDLGIGGIGFQRSDGGKKRFGFHHHTRTAAVGLVVDLAVAIRGPIPEIVEHDLDEPGGPSPAENALASAARGRFREKS